MFTFLTAALSVLAAVLVIAACVSQRKLWWRTHAWRYTDPEANEPSAAGLAVGRVTKLAGASVLAAGAVFVNGPVRGATVYDQRDVWSVALQVAADLDGRPLVDVDELTLQGRVRKAFADAAGGQARFEEKKGTTLARGLVFEVTNVDGDHPVCVTVHADRLPESSAARSLVSVSTSMDEGRC